MPYVLTGGTPGRVHFNYNSVPPPAESYVTQAESIQVRIMNPTIDAQLRIALRFLDLKNEVQINMITKTYPANGNNAHVENFVTTEGFLLGAMIRSLNATRGQCFVQMFIQRGLGGDDTAQSRLMMQGYAATTDYVGFPDSRPESSLSGRGAVRFVLGVDPPIGTPATITVPPGVRWFIRQANATLTKGASSPSDGTFLNVFDGGGNLLYSSLQSVAFGAAAGPFNLVWSVWQQTTAEVVRQEAKSIIDGVPAGSALQVTADNLPADTQMSAFSVTVEEFVEM